MESVLKVQNLQIGLKEKKGVAYPVKDVSFEIKKGETYALVGESGSGKSMTSLCIMGLLQSWKDNYISVQYIIRNKVLPSISSFNNLVKVGYR